MGVHVRRLSLTGRRRTKSVTRGKGDWMLSCYCSYRSLVRRWKQTGICITGSTRRKKTSPRQDSRIDVSGYSRQL